VLGSEPAVALEVELDAGHGLHATIRTGEREELSAIVEEDAGQPLPLSGCSQKAQCLSEARDIGLGAGEVVDEGLRGGVAHDLDPVAR
jgi:hypothetical protein